MSNGMRGIPGTGVPASVAAGSVQPHGGHHGAAFGAAFTESFRAANSMPSAGSIATSSHRQANHAGGGVAVQPRRLGVDVALADMSTLTTRCLRFADEILSNNGNKSRASPCSVSWAIAVRQHATDSAPWVRLPLTGALTSSDRSRKTMVNPASIGVDGLDRQVEEICRFFSDIRGTPRGTGIEPHRKSALRLAGEMSRYTRQALVDAAQEIAAQIAALRGVQASFQRRPAACGDTTPLRIVREGADYFLKPAASHSLLSIKQKAARTQAQHLAVLVGLTADTPVTFRRLSELGFGETDVEPGSTSPAGGAGKTCFPDARLSILRERRGQIDVLIRTLDNVTSKRPSSIQRSVMPNVVLTGYTPKHDIRRAEFHDDFAGALANPAASVRRGNALGINLTLRAWDRS